MNAFVLTTHTPEMIEKLQQIQNVPLVYQLMSLKQENIRDSRDIFIIDLNKRNAHSQFMIHTYVDERKLTKIYRCQGLILLLLYFLYFSKIPKFLKINIKYKIRCLQYDPQNKRQNAKQRKTVIQPKTKMFHFQKSKIESILICFCNSRGVIYKKNLVYTFTSDYCSSVLEFL